MASIHKRGDRFQVRYREGSKNRSRTFPSASLAKTFKGEQERAEAMGGLPVFESGVPFKEFYMEWLLDKQDELAPRTFRAYTSFLRAHVADDLGHIPIGLISPKRLDEWKRERLAAGAGKTALGQTVMMLKAIFKRAVALELIPRNPAESIDRPKAPPKREAIIPTPDQIEALRGWMVEGEHHLDAAYISVLAYAGLRPGEALALRWDEINDRVMHVYATKTGRTRRVKVEPHLAADLAVWRAEGGAKGLVFPRHDGREWTNDDYHNWRRRIFSKAAEDFGLELRPYDLRHFRASHLIYQALPVTEVAKQMGHSPAVCLSTYAHVFEDPPQGDPAEWVAKAKGGMA